MTSRGPVGASRSSIGVDAKQYDILVVDDEVDNLDAFRFAFRKTFRLHFATSGQAALELVAAGLDPAVVVADQRMPRMTGIVLLRRIKEVRADASTVLLTAYADLDVLVDAVNSGAVDRYLAKPWDGKELEALLRQGIGHFATRRENRRLRRQVERYAGYLEREQHNPLDFGQVVGGGAATQRVLRQVEEVAPTATTVLIEGETGLEKDVVARAIHVGSSREASPFVAVRCAAFPGVALERELFGYARGAFEGALRDREGRAALAFGGTLYLHELGTLRPAAQGRLLRLLEERKTERVGETQPRAADVRLVVSCAPDLDRSPLAEGLVPELRSRLEVFPIRLEPLRSRPEDLRPLAEHFLRKHAQRNGRPLASMSAEAVAALEQYAWPGNVRELESVLERAAILAGDGVAIDVDQLLFRPGAGVSPPPSTTSKGLSLSGRLDAMERSELLAALERYDGNKAEVARALGIHRTTLYYRLKKLGIDA
ncbi:MAG: sigma-54 dependent transcriptional regulator [Myxococcota bacterium]